MPSAIHRLLFAFALIALTPTSALAEWRRAESANFVVYSDGSERSLREYTAKLERFDALGQHRTQPVGFFLNMPEDLLGMIYSRDYFVLLRSHVETERPESDLFAGLA